MNCWIDNNGTVRAVRSGHHAVERRRQDYIRVSSPEGRRTYVGIEVSHRASLRARRALLKLIKQLRKSHEDIVATVDNVAIECYTWQRPTKLNKAIVPAHLLVDEPNRETD